MKSNSAVEVSNASEHYTAWCQAILVPSVTDFLAAAAAGDIQTVECFLAAGGSPDERDEEGRTATMLAALFGHRQILKALLTAGAKTCVSDLAGRPTEEYIRDFGIFSMDNRVRSRTRILRLKMRHTASSRTAKTS